MRFTAASVTLLLCGATAMPTLGARADGTLCFTENGGLGPRVADFTSWITDCGDKFGHTTGHNLAYQTRNDLCFPLPDDTRGLEVHDVAQGCRSESLPQQHGRWMLM